MNPSIQYTITTALVCMVDSIRYKCSDFLSIRVLQQSDGTVCFDVYYKETNAHDYLAFDTLAKRTVVISSKDAWVERNLCDLRQFLLDRKYPADVVEKGIYNAQLQGPAPPSSNTRVVPLITPFLGNLDSSNIVNTARDLITSSSNERLHKAFDGTKLVQCYSQTPNLLQIVSSSRFNSNNREGKERGVFRCSSKKCEICAFGYLQQCKEFIVSNGTTWNVKCHITRGSLNVIYFLVCSFCQKVTKLGKTDDLRARTNNHRSGCRSGKTSDIFDNHVYSCHHSQGIPPTEPMFLLYVLMACSDFNKLLGIERDMHLKGFDTLFKVT